MKPSEATSLVPKLPLISLPNSARGGKSSASAGNGALVPQGGGGGPGTPRSATFMSSTRTKYTLVTAPNTADGGGGGVVQRITPRQMQQITGYLAANKNLSYLHRSGNLTTLIPQSPFLRVEGNADLATGLRITSVHPKESALDVPLRLAPPSNFHCPPTKDPRSGATMAARLVSLLKGAAGFGGGLRVRAATSGEAAAEGGDTTQQADPIERDVAHSTNVRDCEMRILAARRAGHAQVEAQAYFTLAILHYNSGSFEKAVQFFTPSAALFESLADMQGLALCHNLMGVSYYKLENYKVALVHFKKQETLCASYGRSVAQTNIGIIYSALGQLQYAEQAHNDALINATDAQDPVLEAVAHGNLGVANMRIGDMKRGQGHIEECLERCSVAGDKVGAAVCLLLLGEIYTQVADHAHAQFYYEHAFRVADEAGCRDITEIARVSVGVARGNQKVQEQVLNTARKMGHQVNIRDALICLPRNA